MLKKIAAVLLALMTLLAVFVSCESDREDPDAQSTENRADATEPVKENAYELYKIACDKIMALNSEKINAEITLDLKTKMGEQSLVSTFTQTSTQVVAFDAEGNGSLSSETTDRVLHAGSSQADVSKYNIVVKEGVAYLDLESGKIKTEDLARYGLDKTSRDEIHDYIAYKLTEEDLESAELSDKGGKRSLSLTVPGEKMREDALKLFDTMGVLRMFFGTSGEQNEDIEKMLKISDVEFELVFAENGYFDSENVAVGYAFTIPEDRQEDLFGFSTGDDMDVEIDIRQLELFVEPGKEYTVELPKDADQYEIPAETGGAESIDALCDILAKESSLTAEKVSCMSQEFLFSCLMASDPQNGRSLYESGDFEKMAEALNAKLFKAADKKPVKYIVSDYAILMQTDEQRKTVQDWFAERFDAVAEVYGEYFAQKVYEENEGRTALVFPKYKTEDVDGNVSDEINSLEEQANNDGDALIFSIISGGFYWSDGSLLENFKDK
ncbi:MAG: hypothetical protein IJR90_01795 [Clostridia bacterium]|nr:hypothetical protein [Clostridia bacterium]